MARIAATSSAAWLTSWFTTTASNSVRPSSSSAGGAVEPPGERFGRLAPPRFEPAALFGPGGRLEEHEQGVRDDAADRERALHVDFEHHVATGGELVDDELLGGAPEVAEHLERLEEAAGGPEPLELLRADEVVVDALGLVGPPGPRGPRDGPPERRVPLPEQLADRSLPGPGGAGENEQDPLGYGVPPSRLRWSFSSSRR